MNRDTLAQVVARNARGLLIAWLAFPVGLMLATALGTQNKGQADNQQAKTNTQAVPGQSQPAQQSAEQANQQQPWLTGTHADWTMVFLTLAAIGGALVTLAAVEQQAETAAGQLLQLKSQIRPWLGLDRDKGGVQTGRLEVQPDGSIRGQVSIFIRNYGDYPAQRMIASADLLVSQVSTDGRMKAYAEMGGPPFGSTVFPGPSGVAWSWPLHVTRNDFIVVNPNDEVFHLRLIGCIHYVDQFGAPHRTAFEFILKRPNSIATVAVKPVPGRLIDGNWIESNGFVD